ncbi:hypothetical protein K461DRAFT_298345 [Myriangium duriaei CBS 260.36]|uniref:BTB domain-containing protein n=1 Tax=Myriangium duriaei CBS 260.36 TaxID=1168546 RepID=A0A9P4IPI6_9PEZI|nr:hypothetical protein K461DRAFT_298345 [Myriangium duriaei CBS 260.36]
MAQPSTEKKHVRQNTRIVPAIPKHFGRKSIDKKHKKEPDSTEHNNFTPVNGEAESSKTYKNDSPNSVRELVTHGISPSPVSTASEDATHKDPVIADSSAVSVASPALGEHKEGLASATPDHTASANHESEEPHTVGGGDADIASETTSSDKISAANKSPVELPPPFYPASHAALRGRDASNRRSFVFGGTVDSSAPSPVPPLSAGSWNSSAGFVPTDGMTSPTPPQMNGFGRPAPYMNGARPAPAQVQGTGPFNYPNHYSQPSQSIANGHPAQPPRQWQSSQHMHPNRSASISSNPSDIPYPPQYSTYAPAPTFPFYNSTDGSLNGMNMPRNLQYPSYPPAFHSSRGSGHFDPRAQAGPTPDYHNAQSLRDHVDGMFDTTEHSDCVLRFGPIKDADKDIPGHAVILSRSPKLRRLLSQTATTGNAAQPRVVDISADIHFHGSAMFNLALRYLYGGSLIRRDHLQSNLGSPTQAMSSILSYVWAGWFLEMPEIATAGLALATEFLLPDNLEVALDFALKQDATSQPTTNGHQSTPPHIPKYYPYSNELLFSIQRFLTFPLTNGFELDPSTPELDNLPRIPLALRAQKAPGFHASRPSVNHPKLQAITLGSFQAQTSANRTLSSVLLSIPSFVLQALFADRAFRERMPPDAAVGLATAVIAEREKRRHAAVGVFDTLGEAAKDGLGGAMKELSMEEQVETIAPEMGGFRVVVKSGVELQD